MSVAQWCWHCGRSVSPGKSWCSHCLADQDERSHEDVRRYTRPEACRSGRQVPAAPSLDDIEGPDTP